MFRNISKTPTSLESPHLRTCPSSEMSSSQTRTILQVSVLSTFPLAGTSHKFQLCLRHLNYQLFSQQKYLTKSKIDTSNIWVINNYYYYYALFYVTSVHTAVITRNISQAPTVSGHLSYQFSCQKKHLTNFNCIWDIWLVNFSLNRNISKAPTVPGTSELSILVSS